MALSDGSLRCLPSEGDAIGAAAQHVAGAIRAGVEARPAFPFRLALQGASTGKKLYERMVRDAVLGRKDWARVEFFFGDERAVPPDKAASNYRLAKETLFEPLGIDPARIHRMRGEDEPRRAGLLYEADLGEAPLDLVLLGMGEDGHVASLFPGGPELLEVKRRVVASESPVAPAGRISLSLRAIDEAREVVFVVTGAKKAERLAEVMAEREGSAPRLPAAMVRRAGPLVWLVDEAAASRLPRGHG